MKRRLLIQAIALGCITLAAQGQTVHSVKGSALWFQAAPVTDSLLNGSYHFHDRSGNELMLYAGTGTTEYTQARNLINTFNFNPAIDLSSYITSMLFPFRSLIGQRCLLIGYHAEKYLSENLVMQEKMSIFALEKVN